MAPTSNDRPTGGKDSGRGTGSSGSGRGSWVGGSKGSSSRTSGGGTGEQRSSSRTRSTTKTASPSEADATTTVTAGPATLTGTSQSPKSGTSTTSGKAGANGSRGPRRIRLTLARLDPFSVMKLSFLLSIGIGIATVIAVALLWNIVDSIGLWDSLNKLGSDLNGNKPLTILDLFTFSKMVSYATVVAVVNIVIITALGTLFAFLYNIVAGLLGGLKMTFTDQ